MVHERFHSFNPCSHGDNTVVREAQAQGACASELVPGHLPSEDPEARHGRLFGVAKKVHLWAGGRKVVPDGALLPLARTRPQRPDPREGAGPRPVLAPLLPKP